MSQRQEALRAMLAQTPDNSFLRYGLALDLAGSGDLEGALGEFEALVARDPDYKAAYFHAGQAAEKLGRKEAARDWYRRGIEVTARLGDEHARSELQGALDMLV
jgi:tetratricopeptide (TPR) repeat protein